MERLVIRLLNTQRQNSLIVPERGAGVMNWDAIRLINEFCTENTHITNPRPLPHPRPPPPFTSGVYGNASDSLQNDSLPVFRHFAFFFPHLHLVR